MGEHLPFEHLHRQRMGAAGILQVIDRDGVGTIGCRENSCFSREQRQTVCISREGSGLGSRHDIAAECRIAGTLACVLCGIRWILD